MNINITAGDCLNETLKTDAEEWIPFREAMSEGSYASPLFSEDFCRERASVHAVSFERYTLGLSGFMRLLDSLEDYDSVTLWFGEEPFCAANRRTVLQALRDRHYNGTVVLNTVNEPEGTVIRSGKIDLTGSEEACQHGRIDD